MGHISISELAAKIGESEERLISAAEKTVLRRMERVQASDTLVAAQAEQLAREVGKNFQIRGMTPPAATSFPDDPAINEWNSNKALQREFPTAATYAAYKKAASRGEIKVLSKQTITGGNNHV